MAGVGAGGAADFGGVDGSQAASADTKVATRMNLNIVAFTM